MNIDNHNNMMSAALRCGVSLLMLSGTCALGAYAQEPTDAAGVETSRKAATTKAKRPVYQMKEVTGVVYDAATRKPLSGVRVQALNNCYYTAMTDEQGAYKISVPEHVTALYFSTEDYNGLQLGIREGKANDAFIYSVKFKPLYTDGTEVLQKGLLMPKTSSAVSIEGDLENTLNAS